LAQIDFPEALSKHGDFARAWPQVPGKELQEGRLARSVRAQHRPMLTGPDFPGNSVQYGPAVPYEF